MRLTPEERKIMKDKRHIVQSLAVISLILILGSGLYDMWQGIQTANKYVRWHEETYGYMGSVSMMVSYAILVLRGTAVALGCGVIGLAEVIRKKVRVLYLLYLGFWTVQYVQTIPHKAYKGIWMGDVIQALIAVFALVMLSVYKGIRQENQQMI